MHLGVTIGKRKSGGAIMISGGEVNDLRSHAYAQTRVIDRLRVLIHDDPQV